jgi:hypothetical protein
VPWNSIGRRWSSIQIAQKRGYERCNGHAIILTAYLCFGTTCTQTHNTTMAVSTNLHNPESCFIPSPHSLFLLQGSGNGSLNQTVLEGMWVCENILSGTQSFTVTCNSRCFYFTALLWVWREVRLRNN